MRYLKVRRLNAVRRHLKAKGAEAVLLTAPGKGDVPNIVHGVNHEQYNSKEEKIFSAASCTTNAVVPIVASSALAGRHWSTPLDLVFIDGGHSLEAALTDYRTWAPKIRSGGVLAIHDIFPDPAEGGQAPYDIYQLAIASGLFEVLPMTKTLGVLRRI